MRVNKNINNRQGLVFSSLMLLILMLPSCIEEYYPEINSDENLLVIDGSIIKEDSVQKVSISRLKSIYEHRFKPVSECTVWAVDKDGNEFFFEESDEGEYLAVIPEQFLNYNSTFKLRVTTGEGEEYESDFESILESSPVDSLYFAIEYSGNALNESYEAVQFYTDLKASDELTKNYRWVVEEAWEKHRPYLIGGYFDADKLSFEAFIPDPSAYNPSDSSFSCYRSRLIAELFTTSTQNLMINEKKKIPLNVLPLNDPKLNVQYSLFVKQYTLSDKAYEYWSQKKVQTKESGGLYQTQPGQSISNLHNINDPDEIVLGYFWASSFTEKRIWLRLPTPGIFCEAETLSLFDIYQLKRSTFIPLIGWGPFGSPIFGVTEDVECFYCEAYGGTSIRPDYWE